MSKVKLVALVLALVLVLPAALVAAPQAGDVVFTVGQAAYWTQDGHPHQIDAAPLMIDGQIYLPADGVAKAMGMTAKSVPQLSEVVFLPPKDPIPPSTVSGSIMRESLGNIVNTEALVTVNLTGPTGTKTENARLDTGSTMTAFPDKYLRGLGFTPFSGPTFGLQAQGNTQVYYYKVPYPAIDGETGFVPLGQGMITIEGIVGAREALIGCDILSRDNLILHNDTWTLTVTH